MFVVDYNTIYYLHQSLISFPHSLNFFLIYQGTYISKILNPFKYLSNRYEILL
jgi:hypothetical protein